MSSSGSSRNHSMAVNVVLVLGLVLALVGHAAATLEMVLIFHRHGARTPLYKDALTLAEGGAMLTTQGEEQLFRIGQTFRATYLDPATCGNLCLNGLPNGTYDQTKVRIISSAFDRTLASATSFLQGAFPDGNTTLRTKPIPIYSVFQPDDYLIRAYGNCPAFLKNTQAWFKSTEFAAKAAEVAPLLATLSANLKANVTLQDFYNTYDDLQTQRDVNLLTGNVTYNDVVWEQVLTTANWLESKRYSRQYAKNLCGGSLLSEILIRLEARKTDLQPAANRIVEYSAHYPALMCLLAAIPNLKENASSFTSKIPNYGAALIFEMHSAPAASGGNASYAVLLKQQDGSDANYTVIPLPCESTGGARVAGAAGACLLEDFQKLVGPEQFQWQSQWCKACNNTVMPACYGSLEHASVDRPCTYVEGYKRPNTAAIKKEADAAASAAAAKAAPKKHVCLQRPKLKIALGTGIGTLGGAAVAAGLTYCLMRRRHRRALVGAYPKGAVVLHRGTSGPQDGDMKLHDQA